MFGSASRMLLPLKGTTPTNLVEFEAVFLEAATFAGYKFCDTSKSDFWLSTFYFFKWVKTERYFMTISKKNK